MHVVSVFLYYGKIIWLPWQRPLTNWKIMYKSIPPGIKHFHTVKRLRKLVQYIRRYSTKNASFWLCRTWRSQMRTINSEVTGPNFTKFSHDIEASFALLLRSARPWYCNSFSSISNECKRYQSALITFLQHDLVAMATTLDKLENKVQIHHVLVKCFHVVKRFRKSVQYIWRYSTKMHQFFWPCRNWRSQMSKVNSGVTWPNFMKLSHNIEAWCTLLTCILRLWYPIPFRNGRAISAGG